MKQFIVISLTTFLLFSHCDPGLDEGYHWTHYYVFVTESGEDFFESNEFYSPEEVWHLNNSRGFVPSEDSKNGLISVPEYADHNVFENGRWFERQFIDFGNGDIDTLWATWKPNTSDPHWSENANNLRELHYYLNDILLISLDLNNDTQPSGSDLLKRYREGKPHIFEIPKEPDPEEFFK